MVAQELAGTLPSLTADAAVVSAPRWNLLQRVAFRFFFSYFALYFAMMLPLWRLPFGERVLEKYVALWLAIVTWVAKSVLQVPYDIYLIEGGGGISNTPYGSILFLCYVALAAVATVIWSVLDRRRPHYRLLHQWFRLALRYTLSLIMISYGTLKVIPTQMISPLPLGVLAQRVGDLTRMRLLWIFMGASPTFESFTGMAELGGAVLLLFPRTTFLGALVCAGNLLTVFTLNMCYDVHVKLHAFHLLFMAVLLAAPGLPRLAAVLLGNGRVEPAEPPPPLFANKWLNRAPHVLLCLFGCYLLVMGFDRAWTRYQESHPPRPPLYGVWRVEEMVVDGQEVPYTEAGRWRFAYFQNPGGLSIEPMLGARLLYELDLGLESKTMKLARLELDDQGQPVTDAQGEAKKAEAGRAVLTFTEPDEDVLVLDGQLDGRPVRVKLHKMALIRRAFRWVWDPGPDVE